MKCEIKRGKLCLKYGCDCRYIKNCYTKRVAKARKIVKVAAKNYEEYEN